MSLSCSQIDPKLGLNLAYPPLELAHSYLEHLLRVADRLSVAQFWVGKLDEGVTPADLERLQQQGKTLICASGRSAYFADPATAEFIAQRLYPHPSDAVAYGSLPVSAAQTSTVIRDRRAQLWVIDDEAPGTLPLLEHPRLAATLSAMAQKLGDCYMLISPELAAAVEAHPHTPFQFRAATPDWLGMIKGTCRVSQGCTDLGVDAIVPLSSTKGHGKTLQPGFYEVEQFFLSRKSDAQLREQKLGIQALVNLPEGTIAEILPRLHQDAERLSAIQQDPRQIAQRYVQSVAHRQRRSAREELSEAVDESSPSDWLSEVLKGDPNYQLLQHDRVQDRLQQFMSGEWEEIATGGVYVPQAMAQPHRMLATGEICVPSMMQGEHIALYRSPVANVAAFDVFVNTIHKLQQQDPEAFEQQGVCYLNPEDAQRLVIDFDGDTVALIREQDFPVLVQEIQAKNRPDQKPIQVQKEAKIPRPWHPGQTYTQALAVAAIAAANNPVGRVANQGMTIESLRQEIFYLPDEQKASYLKQVAGHWQKLLEAAVSRTLPIPTDMALQRDGFAAYGFAAQILQVVQTTRNLSSQPPEQQPQTVAVALKQVQQLLFQTQSLVAVNLQRAVDAPKSARGINLDYQTFAQAVVGYKPHAVMLHKKAANLYRGSQIIPVNTCDPIGMMVNQANRFYSQAQLPVQERKQFKGLFPRPDGMERPEVKAFAEHYNHLIRQAAQDLEHSLRPSEPRLILTSGVSGRQLEVRDALRLNPDLDHPLWAALRSGEPLDVVIVPNEVVSPPVGGEYVAKLRGQGEPVIGFVAQASLDYQGIHLSPQQRLTIAQAQVTVRASHHEIAKRGVKQAQQLLEQFVALIPAPDRPQVAAYLWHNGGQAVCLKAFPHEVIYQLQRQDLQLTVVGLQFPSNEWQGRAWLGENVPIRIAQDTNPQSSTYNRAILQVGVADDLEQTWKTLGSVSTETTQIPIGTQAQANIYGAIAKVTTKQGNTLSLRNLESHELAPEAWQGKAQMKFHRQGQHVLAQVEREGIWKTLGSLDKDSVAFLHHQEKQLQRSLIDSGCVLKDFEISAAASKTAQIIVDRASLQYPEQWISPVPVPMPLCPKQPEANLEAPQLNQLVVDDEQGRQTAIAALNLLKSHPEGVDGIRVYEGSAWRIQQQHRNLIILDKTEDRTILQVTDGKLTHFNPQSEDQERLKFLNQRYGQVQQQQQHSGLKMRH